MNNKYAVGATNFDEAANILAALHKAGYRWNSGEPITKSSNETWVPQSRLGEGKPIYFGIYPQSKRITFGARDMFETKIEIVESEELEEKLKHWRNKMFKKSDLKTGMIVKTERENNYIVLGNFLVNEEGFLTLEDFNEDLTFEGPNVGFDIVKVMGVNNDSHQTSPGVGVTGLKVMLNIDNPIGQFMGKTVLYEREKMPVLSKKAVEILKFVQHDYQYILRNKDGILMVRNGPFETPMSVFDHDFKHILNGEEYNIRQLIKSAK